MYVGDAGTGEKRHPFDTCPGYYLRDSSYKNFPSIDGNRNSFDVSWHRHWAYSNGMQEVGVDGNVPPKLMQAILLIESENRARSALKMQKQIEENKKQSLSSRNKRTIKG